MDRLWDKCRQPDDVSIDERYPMNNVQNEESVQELYDFSRFKKKIEDGNPKQLTTFLNKNVNEKIDYVDSSWYGWTPIHYAAKVSDPDKLEIICKNLGKERINSLTVLSENALHILLEHSNLAKFFYVSRQNGEDIKMGKIINSAQKNIKKCVEKLIEYGIDVNHSNFWNETPILIASKKKYFGIAELLIQKSKNVESEATEDSVDGTEEESSSTAVDLDTCKDAISGKTARELLKSLKNLPPHFKSEHQPTKKILFQFLKSGNEEAFVRFGGGKIESIDLNSFDGDNEENSSCTLLQYCFRRGLVFWYHEKDECDFQEEDMTTNRVVDIFCYGGLAKCVQHLLDNGVDVYYKELQKFEGGKSVVEAAIIKGYYPILGLILSKREINDPERLSKAMVMLVQNPKDTYINELNHTLSLVLSKLTQSDNLENLYTSSVKKDLLEVFKSGVRKICRENLLLLLKFPGSLCWTKDEKKSKISILEDVDPEIIQTHLDNCLEPDDKLIDFKINDSSFLEGGSLSPVFEIFVHSSKLKQFLTHPVFKILIKEKWNDVKTSFSVIFWFYVSFCLCLHFYIFFKFNDLLTWHLELVAWLLWGIFLIKESFQVVASFGLYFKEPTNWLELGLLILTAILFSFNDTWIDTIEVLTIIFSDSVFLFLLFNFPSCAKFFITFRTIRFYFLYIIFYFIQFWCFAFCFYILLAKQDQVPHIDIFNRLFDTIILFTGNLDYMETFWKEDKPTPNDSTNCTCEIENKYLEVNITMNEASETESDLFHDFVAKELFAKVFFIFFVILIPVILQNLLIGLLVVDMDDLHKRRAVSEQVKRAKYVIRMEKYQNNPLSQRLSNFLVCSQCQRNHDRCDSFCIQCLQRENSCQRSCMRWLCRMFCFRVEGEGNSTPLTVNRNKLDDDEMKQELDMIFRRRVKKRDPLKKLSNHIKMKISEQISKKSRNENSKKIFNCC